MSRRAKYSNWRRLGKLPAWWEDLQEQWEPETPVYECPECFAVVTNPGRHQQWHAENLEGQ